MRITAFCVLVAGIAPALFATPVPADAAAKPARRLEVVYIEGSPRWEYRWHRTLLERAGEKKEFSYRVFLTEADPKLAETDTRALAEFPIPTDLAHADLVILGDIDPKDPRIGEKNLKRLATFVTEQGCGLLVLAGPHHNPQSLKDTPLEGLLPIVLGEKPASKGDKDEAEPLTVGYRVRPTTAGLKQPAFRLGKDDDESHAIWDRLPVMYRHATGYTARPGAEVLAVHQTEGPASAPHPLIVTRKAGKGRVTFVGFDESWRWRRNEGEQHYQTFWVNLWRGMAAE